VPNSNLLYPGSMEVQEKDKEEEDENKRLEKK
jgi:hypothetical protein